MTFQIKQAIKKDAAKLAVLHKTEIPTGFISSLNIKVVKKLYETLISRAIVITISDEKSIIGFVSCTLKTKQLYITFFKRNFFSVLPYFMLKVFSISFIKKVFETLRAPAKTRNQKGDDIPELLSIVIDHNQQAKGLGKLLLDRLEKELKTKNISKYKVVAGEKLMAANRFYQKYGFDFIRKTEIHKGEQSNIYIKTISYGS